MDQVDPRVLRDVPLRRKKKHDPNNNRITINVSGLVFETYERTLAKFPESLLGSPAKRAAYYNRQRDEYYFNRNRSAFDSILFFYQSNGKLVTPEDLSEEIFLEEVRFYGLNAGKERTKKTRESAKRSEEDNQEAIYVRVIEGSWSHCPAETRTLLDQPNDGSVPAKLLGAWSALTTIAFIAMLCVKTLPEFQQIELPCGEGYGNLSVCTYDTHEAKRDISDFVWSVFEKVCVSWFTLEFIARLLCASRRSAYLFSGLGLIDFLSFFPSCLLILLQATAAREPRALKDFLQFLRFLSVIKLTRYSLGLRLFWDTLRSCRKELMLLSHCLLINIIAFSSLVYYCEYQDNKEFTSIPASFWYTIVTMTTVGYGDITPGTLGGKVFGAVCALFGVTYLLALPATIIVSEFNSSYEVHGRKSVRSKLEENTKIFDRQVRRISKKYRWTTQYRSVSL